MVSNFIVQALCNLPISIYGDGDQTPSFCYVDDLIEGMVRFMNAPDKLTGPLNLGNPVEITVTQPAERVIELTGSKSRPVYYPLPHDDRTRRCPDISLAQRHLDWRPAVSLNEGLQKTIDYFDRVLRGAMSAPAGDFMIDIVALRPAIAATYKL
jgi:UDP-glucuronate decarboxylase